MKLLEEIPSSTTPRPSGRRVLVTMVATLFVVVAATFIGYTLLMGGDDSDEEGPVELSGWVEQATGACMTVAEEHSVLTQGQDAKLDPENTAAVEQGVTALIERLNELPPVSNTQEAEQTEAVIALGVPAQEAWQSLVDAENPERAEIEDAVEQTQAFVAGLVDLGADCGVLD
ncbi:hypothetical protein [Phytoactinopolyspora halotolerans]|uniref:Uncharacterized protein n=1 Tax=Phytoactinopolyspora halotolerans TaxID=1981512 RepID=A0A6L9S815_9ACTN|nr:hypothetical protein [Phytoactinopolyspora halotolerans]NEE01143.1 hypothetical protein [Phytoactinopolyspora halotolerans]